MKKFLFLLLTFFLAGWLAAPVQAESLPEEVQQMQDLRRLEKAKAAQSNTTVKPTVTPTQEQQYAQFLRQLDSSSPVAVAIPKIFAQEDLVIEEDIEGDLYAFGSNVQIDGNVTGDVIAAGANVIINGNISDDLRVAGAKVIINGQVGKNVTVGAAELTFGEMSRVNGSVIAGAGDSMFSGEINGKLWLGSGNAILAGNFNNDVEVSADNLTSRPSTYIVGDLKARVGAESTDDASLTQDQVAGKIDISRQPVEESAPKKVKVDSQKVGSALIMAEIVKIVFKFITGMIVGSLALYFLPQVSKKVVSNLTVNPFASLGYGFAALILTPIAAILLMVMVVTLPLGIFSLFIYVMMLMAAKWVSAKALGTWMAKLVDEKWLKNDYVQLALGLFILFAFGAIPVLGWAVKAVALFLGTGALTNLLVESLSKRGKA